MWRLENKWNEGANDIENSPFAPRRGGNIRDDLASSSRTAENSIGSTISRPWREEEEEDTRPKQKRDDKRWERIGSEADIKPRIHVGKQFGYCPNKSTLSLIWMLQISGRRDETAFLWRVFFRCSIYMLRSTLS